MANEVLLKQGTSIEFSLGGPSDVTFDYTELAPVSARQSDSYDFGTGIDTWWSVLVEIEFDFAANAGDVVDIYLAWSDDNSKWPGGVTGSDAAYKAAEEKEWAAQLDYLGSLICTNDGDGTDQITIVGSFIPIARYVSVVVKNEAGQAFSETAGDHIVTLIPMTDEIQK